MTSYLAAEDSAMDRRSRGLHRFLVSSPVVLLIAISAVGHLRKPAHLGAAGTADYDQRVLAYRDRVVAADRLTGLKDHNSLAELRAEAKNWTDGFESGQLKPLEPAAYEDHLRDGVRGDILTSGLRLGSQLSFQARNALRSGSYAQAADASMLATETVLGMRRFELEAYLLCVHSARRSLDILESAWPHLTLQHRQTLTPRLKAMEAEPGEPASLAQLDDLLVKDYFARQGRQSSVPRQNASLMAKERAQRVKTADKVTETHNEIIAKLIGPSGQS